MEVGVDLSGEFRIAAKADAPQSRLRGIQIAIEDAVNYLTSETQQIFVAVRRGLSHSVRRLPNT